MNGSYQEQGYTYTVNYDPGEQTTQNENVRTDKVTNSRPGIVIHKTDWTGRPLEGSVFTLKDEEGTWQIRVWNNPGYSLPSTGGAGSGRMYLRGIMLILLAGAGYILHHLQEQSRAKDPE